MMATHRMYNQSQKEEYISFENTNKDTLRRYFVRLEPKETEYGKDVSAMSVDELKDTIIYLGIRRDESRGHLISIIRGYVNWVNLNKQSKDYQSAIEAITPQNTGSKTVIQESMIKDSNHLEQIINNSLDFVEYENKSTRDALILWLLYSGVRIEELKSLRKNDIDLENMIVTTISGIYQVNDKVADLWDMCSKMKYIEKRKGRKENSKKVQGDEFTDMMLVDNDFVFRRVLRKGTDNKSSCDTTFFRNILNSFFDDGNSIPARNIYYSGIFYRLHSLENKGVLLTPEMFADAFKVNYNSNTEMFAKTRKWRIDYEDWKFAFGYI